MFGVPYLSVNISYCMPPPVTSLFTFACVLARIGGLVALTPLFGSKSIPVQVRACIALALTLVIAPPQAMAGADVPSTWIAAAMTVGGEVLVGLTLGLGVAMLMAAAQLAGQLVSQMSGLSIAEVLDPAGEAAEPLLSRLLYMLALVMFVAAGAHRLVIGALLDTYASMPIGHLAAPQALADLATSLLSDSFSLAVRAAAPVMIALLLATIVVGLVSRTIPQLNVLSLGFGLNTLVALGALALSAGVIALLLESQLEPTLQSIVSILSTPPSGRGPG